MRRSVSTAALLLVVGGLCAPEPSWARDVGLDAYVVDHGRLVARLGEGNRAHRLLARRSGRCVVHVSDDALQAQTLAGATLWRRVPPPTLSRMRSAHLLEPDVLVVAREDSLDGLSLHDGALLYHRTVPTTSYVHVEADAAYVYESGGSAQVTCLDLRTGKVRWSRVPAGLPAEAPILRIQAGAVQGGASVRWHAFDPRTGLAPPQGPPPASFPPAVFLDETTYQVGASGALEARRRRDGELLWKLDPTEGIARLHGLQGGWAVASGASKTLLVDTRSPHRVWRLPCRHPPQDDQWCVHAGHAAVITDDTLRILDLASGEERLRRRLGHAAIVAPGHDETFLVAYADPDSDAGRLLVIDAGSGRERWHWDVPTVGGEGRIATGLEARMLGAHVYVARQWIIPE